MTAGLRSSRRMIAVEVVGDLADRLAGEHLGVRVGLLDRLAGRPASPAVTAA